MTQALSSREFHVHAATRLCGWADRLIQVDADSLFQFIRLKIPLMKPMGYLGAVGPKHRRGSLLVVYQAPRARSHQLVPLAVLTMHSPTSGVKSIQAGDDYAP